MESPEAKLFAAVAEMIFDYEEGLVPEEQWWAVVRGQGIAADGPVDQGADAVITAAANTAPPAPSPVQLPNAGAPLAAALPITRAPSPLPLPTAGAPLIADGIQPSPSPSPSLLPAPVITTDAIEDPMAIDEKMATAPAARSTPPSPLVEPNTVTDEAAMAIPPPRSDEGMLVDVPAALPPSPRHLSVTSETDGDVLDMTSPSSP